MSSDLQTHGQCFHFYSFTVSSFLIGVAILVNQPRKSSERALLSVTVVCESGLLFNLRPFPFVLAQTCSQTELENWITAIHSACATAVARLHHREDTVRLLRAEIKKLEQKIDMDEKMKKMGDMQLSAVTDTKKRKTILDQVSLISPCFAAARFVPTCWVAVWNYLDGLQ